MVTIRRMETDPLVARAATGRISHNGHGVSTIELRVNGAVQRLAVDDDELLLHVLRRRLGCTSVREGCGVGMCGACTVLVNGPA
jgi:aerobic-type carbon monoxide dehydrogenase small subunit (CoxS/CutS family)